MLGDVGVMELAVLNVAVKHDVFIIENGVLSDVGEVELVVLNVKVKHGVLRFEDVLVDAGAVKRDVLGDRAHELVNADLEDVDVFDGMLGVVGVVELAVLNVAVEHDVLVFEDVLVDADAVKPNVLGDGVHELIDADVVEDVDVLKEVLSNMLV
eukprot:669980-Amphidinium_carterae.2